MLTCVKVHYLNGLHSFRGAILLSHFVHLFLTMLVIAFKVFDFLIIHVFDVGRSGN